MQVSDIVGYAGATTAKQSFVVLGGNPRIDVPPEIFWMRANKKANHTPIREEILNQNLKP